MNVAVQTPPDHNVFRKEGRRWAISYRGREVQLDARKGIRYLAVLLAQPGDPVHVAALAAAPAPIASEPGHDSSERLRKAVTNRIRDAIERIGAEHEDLGEHLRRAIHTGTHCSYAPGRTVDWDL
ncbi:MAG: hypothetical protein ACREQJ_13390 [Candidatus Binatia bacterium]